MVVPDRMLPMMKMGLSIVIVRLGEKILRVFDATGQRRPVA
jgi:hypothetical protein